MTDKTQAEKVAYWIAGYNLWNALMGKTYPQEYGKPQAFEEPACAGFWRKGVYEKLPNKASKRIGWEPVAIWDDPDHGPVAMVGKNPPVNPQTIWTYVCKNPISEDWFRAVSERGEGWPDDHRTDAVPVKSAETGAAVGELVKETPAERISREVKESEALLASYATIDSDEQSSKARSLQQRFLDLRSEAGKNYDALNAPLLAEQKRIRLVWFPIRDAADAGSNALRAAMGAFEDTKRHAVRLAQEVADKAAREHAEAVRKAEAANKPAPPPPEPAKSNVPAPSAQIRGGAGRAAAVKVEKFVTAIDAEKVFQSFKANPDVIALLTDLSQKAIRAGLTVDGATWEEKSVVR